MKNITYTSRSSLKKYILIHYQELICIVKMLDNTPRFMRTNIVHIIKNNGRNAGQYRIDSHMLIDDDEIIDHDDDLQPLIEKGMLYIL